MDQGRRNQLEERSHCDSGGVVYTTDPLHVFRVLPNVGLTNARCVTPAVVEVEDDLAGE